MVAVAFDNLRITPVGDEANWRTLPLASMQLAPIITVAVRQYTAFLPDGTPDASYRAVTTPGRQQNRSFALAIITSADERWLEDHMGALCCFREGTGSKVYGLYTDPTFAPYWGFDGWQGPTLNVQQVTYSESA